MATAMTTKRTRSIRHRARALPAVLAALAVAFVAPTTPFVAEAAAASTPAVRAANRALGRGVNLGNALEAPREGEWGLTLEAGWFDTIADAGFDSVRVPIRWSAHTTAERPWTIDARFLERVDWVLEQTRRTGLAAIVDMHHDDALMANPRAHRARFLSMWRQIATRYADAPDDVLFELLNEPHGAFDDDPALWNTLLADALDIVRRSNPGRAVIVGPVGYNGIDRLDELALPDDPNLIVSVHYYSPFPFTHQGASWVEQPLPSGVRWRASSVDVTVQDWSWDTTSTPGAGALSVRYGRRYAGFSLRTPDPAARPTTLRLRVRGPLDASVGCAAGEGELAFVDTVAHVGGAWDTVSADLSACPADTDRVALMNTATGAPSFDLRHVLLCDRGRGCQRLVASARQRIRDDLRAAAAWGRADDRPMHLGEFGAYGAADLASRVRWTRDVQSIAAAAGLSSAYWEFGAGFGVYDPEAATWRRPLLDALLP